VVPPLCLRPANPCHRRRSAHVNAAWGLFYEQRPCRQHSRRLTSGPGLVQVKANKQDYRSLRIKRNTGYFTFFTTVTSYFMANWQLRSTRPVWDMEKNRLKKKTWEKSSLVFCPKRMNFWEFVFLQQLLIYNVKAQYTSVGKEFLNYRARSNFWEFVVSRSNRVMILREKY